MAGDVDDPLRLIPRVPCDRSVCDWVVTPAVTFRCAVCGLTDHRATQLLRASARIVLGR